MLPGIGVDPGSIVVQALGRQPSSQAAMPGRSASSWAMTATKTRSSFSRTASGQSLGIRVVTPYLGATNGSVCGGSRSSA